MIFLIIVIITSFPASQAPPTPAPFTLPSSSPCALMAGCHVSTEPCTVMLIWEKTGKEVGKEQEPTAYVQAKESGGEEMELMSRTHCYGDLGDEMRDVA